MFYDAYDRIKKERGMTDYQVSQATGISRSTISSWKNSGCTPSFPTVQKLADLFEVDINELSYIDIHESHTEIYEKFRDMQKDIEEKEEFYKVIEYMKKYRVLKDTMLYGGILLESENKKDSESTLQFLEAYLNALKAMNKKGEN